MAAAQLAWGGAQPGKAPTGSRAPSGVWGAPGLPLALLPQLPCPCLAPQGSSLRPLPPHLHLPAQPVPAARLPLLLWAPGGGQRLARGESARALRAWLGQHLRHPYPSRGEKAALAGLSSMSLAQVSTWFANARRRLRREKRLRRGPRGTASEGGEGPGLPPEGPAGSRGPGASRPGPCPEPAPRRPSPSPPAAQPAPETQPGLWSLAELAAAPRPELSRRLPGGAALPCWGHGGAERATYVLAPRLGPALPL